MSANLRYFPQHFRASRPYARELEAGITAAARENRITARDSYDLAASLVLRAYGELGVRPSDPGFSLPAFSQEVSTALTHAQWLHDGSNTFDFAPALCEAFLHSDVDDIRLSSLLFPFPSFYFHFGEQAELPLYGGELHAEGAFLIYSPGQSLRVVLAARYPEDRGSWVNRARECYQLNLGSRHFEADLGTAIDSALADDLEDLRAVARGLPAPDQAELAAKTGGFVEAHQQNLATFRKALRVVVNGLSYLTAYPEDTQREWQAGTPEKLAQKAQRSDSSKERIRAVSKLISQGFLPVRQVGQAFQREVDAEGTQRKAHWRRGHWRLQSYGVGRAQRKLLWIRPARISGSDGQTEHVFKVVDARESLPESAQKNGTR